MFKKAKLFSNKGTIRFENDDFNKIFKFSSEDELKSRKMYTPLGMELSLKWLAYGYDYALTPKFNITSTGENIICVINSPKELLAIDIKSIDNEEEEVARIAQDVFEDVFNLCFLLQFWQLSLYL